MPRWPVWALLLACQGGGAGCDEAVECSVAGRRVGEGAVVDDEARRLRCTCRADGLACEDLPGGPLLGDASVDRGRVDVARDAMVDATADATGVMPDAIADASDAMPGAMPDAAPPACPPWREIGDGSDCPRLAGAVCHQGAPFACCGEPRPGARTCTCDRRWRCVDHVATCDHDPAYAACGRRGRLCARWRAAQALTDPVEVWTGDFDRCIADDMNDRWRDDTLEVINTLRDIAGVPPVSRTAPLDRLAQACALAVYWHGTEDHHLRPETRCYSAETAEGVLESLINVEPAVASVPTYMIDPLVPNMVHRLYLLAPQLGPVGVGSTDRTSCVHVFDDTGDNDDPPWVAWPAPGPFPVDAAFTEYGGWTVQSNVINLSRATARISVDGVERPVTTRALAAPGPTSWALAFEPDGWQIEAGVTYAVEVTGGFRRGDEVPIAYTVEAVDCDAP